MSDSSGASVGMRRGGLALLVLAAFLSGVWLAAELPAGDRPGPDPARKARVEEEEDPAKPDKPPPPAAEKKGRQRVEEEEAPTTPRKVRRVEEDDTPDDTASAAQDGDLRQAGNHEKNPIVKQLFLRLAVPHDLVIYKFISRVVSERGQKEETIEPYPDYAAEGPESLSGPVTFHVLDPRDGKQLREHSPARGTIGSIQPNEEIAERAVRKFLKEKLSDYPHEDARYLSRYQQLQKAERVLSVVLRFHESARQRQARRGPGWDRVQADVRRLLLEVMLEQLQSLRAAEDWDGLFNLTRRLTSIYTQPEERKQIAAPLAEEIQRILTSGSPLISEDRKREARQRLRYLDEQLPGNPVVRDLSEKMQQKAQAYLDQAREAVRKNPADVATAKGLIHQAEEVWPSLPGLHAYKTEVEQKHPVLRVGVRQLPLFMSPARAWTDNELRVVEMLFEGLVKQSPDSGGLLRYRPALAEQLPQVVPLGREFQLARNARWSQERALDAGDVRFSVRQLQTGRETGRWLAAAEMLEEVELRGHAHQVTLRLRHGFLDPLALMTFKIVPQNSKPDSKEFAQAPLGSGPFVYAGRMSEEGRDFFRFIANPYYGIRPSKEGLPRMQEIRLFSYNDALSELRNNRLDLVLDLKADEAAAITPLAAGLRVRLQLPGPSTLNRRIYFLAVNQRKPPLDDPRVRQALAYAINRESLLDHHYRGELHRAVHKALNGPFPAGCWARDPELANRKDSSSLDLFDPALAQARSKEVRNLLRGGVALTLKYPEDDVELKAALTELVDQVRRSTGIELQLVPRNPHGLREDVELTQSYDLAYFHHDYPDETYWLRPLLGSNVPGRNDNYLGFHGGKVEALFDEMRGRRYFPEVQRRMRVAHQELLAEMPLIPLWQLDPLTVVNEDVQAPPFDPQLVFTDVELWKLQRK